MELQHTIKKKVDLRGKGLHTGKKVEMSFKPAPENTGIVFIRTDLPGSPQLRAEPESLLPSGSSLRRTSIGKGNVEIHTIEHVMAVFAGLNIDNIYVELDASEVGGFDGSGEVFLDALMRAGIKEQEAERKCFSLKEPIFVEEKDAMVAALPSSDFRVSYTLSYNHPLLRAQFLDVVVSPNEFRLQIASSRTFCLQEESDELRKQGLGKGANYDNTLVVGKQGVIKNRLRYEDEFVRHKVLDLIGDLYLLGMPVKGHIFAVKSGHSLNLKLLRRIHQQKERYSLGGISAGYQPVEGEQLDSRMIMKILPHRYPFLLVDKIVQMEKGKRAVGVKNVTINDYFFKGHFPGRPIMPGVLIVEAMAQVGGVMMLSPEENRGKLAYFMAVNNVKFRKTVVPGDVLVLEVRVGRIKSKTGQVHGKAFVDGKEVAEADLMFALVEDQ